MAFPRYTITGSVGQREGKNFAVWDRWDRKAISFHSTRKSAQHAAKLLNKSQ